MRSRIIAVTLPLTLVLATIALFLPTGFVVRSPGPTQDTLGARRVGASEIAMVEINGATSFPTSGELRLTTVSVGGGPIGPIMPMDALVGWAVPSRSVVPVETVFRQGETRQEQQERSAAQMVTSQEAATAAALTELGFDIPTTLTIVGTSVDSNAIGVVEGGDIAKELNGIPITNQSQLLGLLTDIAPESTVVLTVEREGELVDLPLVTGRATNDDGSERAALGVFLGTDFEFPIDVAIQIENIGGPSAGLMFALAIIDRLTEVDELQGVSVSGTGTINIAGEVGPIGGVVQKMHGALRDGSNWFLTPTFNCPEVIGAIPRGMNVVAVSTLSEARVAIEAIGAGITDALPSCEAA